MPINELHNSSKKLGINHGGIVNLYINTLKFDIVFMKVSFFNRGGPMPSVTNYLKNVKNMRLFFRSLAMGLHTRNTAPKRGIKRVYTTIT